MTAAAHFLPPLAVPDPADAALVFEALNDLFARDAHDEPQPTTERRQRLAVLLIAAHAETKRNAR